MYFQVKKGFAQLRNRTTEEQWESCWFMTSQANAPLKM